jgi:hypothetical protein
MKYTLITLPGRSYARVVCKCSILEWADVPMALHSDRWVFPELVKRCLYLFSAHRTCGAGFGFPRNCHHRLKKITWTETYSRCNNGKRYFPYPCFLTLNTTFKRFSTLNKLHLFPGTQHTFISNRVAPLQRYPILRHFSSYRARVRAKTDFRARTNTHTHTHTHTHTELQ